MTGYGAAIMRHVNTMPGNCDIDQAYELIIRGFGQVGPERQLDFAASLLLILCNHVSDETVIAEAVEMSLKSLNADND